MQRSNVESSSSARAISVRRNLQLDEGNLLLISGILPLRPELGNPVDGEFLPLSRHAMDGHLVRSTEADPCDHRRDRQSVGGEKILSGEAVQ
jgi:hypothetical protein